MKIGFFHDHKFVVSDGVVYSTGSLSHDVWRRYLDYDDTELLVVARKMEADVGDVSSLKMSSAERVSFSFVDDMSSLSSLVFQKGTDRLESLVLACDRIIARLPSEIGIKALQIAKRNEVPVAAEVVGCPFDLLCNYGSLKGKLYAPFLRRRMKLAVAKADAVVYVTETFLQARYPSKSPQISASNVELSAIRAITPDQAVQKFFGKNDTVNITLIAALHNEAKGTAVAIRALARLADQFSFRLNIIGAGNGERYLALAESLGIAGSVQLRGFIGDRKKLLSILDESDIYIQPSFQEGLPRATLEAMSRGRPVAASSAGGLGELVLPELLHRPGDVGKLAEDLQKLVTDESLYRRAVENSLTVSARYLASELNKKRSEFWVKFYRGAGTND